LPSPVAARGRCLVVLAGWAVGSRAAWPGWGASDLDEQDPCREQSEAEADQSCCREDVARGGAGGQQEDGADDRGSTGGEGQGETCRGFQPFMAEAGEEAAEAGQDPGCGWVHGSGAFRDWIQSDQGDRGGHPLCRARPPPRAPPAGVGEGYPGT